MLVFAASDKGGTGRSITSCNLVYRWALRGGDACYLDFDFGSPTSGSIFQVRGATRGLASGGLHTYLYGSGTQMVDEPRRINVWSESARTSLRRRPAEAGRLVLIPGDEDGGEFPFEQEALERCVALFLRLQEEFDLCLVDLSAGRSHAIQLVLAATADPALRASQYRWLVFHRWTRQHIPAAAGLAFGRDGIVEVAERYGHDPYRIRSSLRFVRTAVVDPYSEALKGLRYSQVAWLKQCDQELRELAAESWGSRALLLGSVPLDPVLQLREQLLCDSDVVHRDIANRETIAAFDELALKVMDDAAWEPE